MLRTWPCRVAQLVGRQLDNAGGMLSPTWVELPRPRLLSKATLACESSSIGKWSNASRQRSPWHLVVQHTFNDLSQLMQSPSASGLILSLREALCVNGLLSVRRVRSSSFSQCTFPAICRLTTLLLGGPSCYNPSPLEVRAVALPAISNLISVAPFCDWMFVGGSWESAD